MKLKRFLAIIALLILTMIMLTGCMDEEIETDANVLLKFDNQQISINPDKGNYVYLEINVKDGNLEDTFTKRFQVWKDKTLTIGVEDIVANFFSRNAQICNVKVVKATEDIFPLIITVMVILMCLCLVLYLLFKRP